MLFKDRHGMEWSWARKEILNRPEVPEWKEIFQIVSPEGEGEGRDRSPLHLKLAKNST